MKLRAAWLGGLWLVMALVRADMVTIPLTPEPTAPQQNAPSAKTPKAPAAPEKEEPVGKIKGMVINRPDGRFLGLEIVGGTFKLSFYNAKKKPVAVDVAMATFRWPVQYQKQDERTVLTPGGDGKSLSSERNVRPPYNFKLFISLFVAGNDNAVESYVLDYNAY